MPLQDNFLQQFKGEVRNLALPLYKINTFKDKKFDTLFFFFDEKYILLLSSNYKKYLIKP